MVSIVHLVLVHTSLSVVAIDDTIGVDVIQLLLLLMFWGSVLFLRKKKNRGVICLCVL